MIRGVIFDLDGTLVDSRLDFDAIRREMDLPPGAPVLETVLAMDEDRAADCWQILKRHESEGADRAVPLPGAAEFAEQLHDQGVRLAIVTRNTRSFAQAMLTNFPNIFDPIICREDGPVKPDPWSILHICRTWGLKPDQVVVIGDFRFDIEAGRRAGATTVLLARGREPGELAGADDADYVLNCFTDTTALIEQWFKP